MAPYLRLISISVYTIVAKHVQVCRIIHDEHVVVQKEHSTMTQTTNVMQHSIDSTYNQKSLRMQTNSFIMITQVCLKYMMILVTLRNL